MNFKLLVFSVVALTLCSCNPKRNIFEIQTPDSILRIADSISQVPYNSADKIPLTFYEKMNNHYYYRKVASIFKNENFEVVTILSQKREDKFYHLLARTINLNDDKIIDTFLLASYNENTKEFCSGFINNSLKVSRTCKNINFTLEKQIDTFGNITPINN